MIMHVLKACGRTFDYLVGAAIPGFSQAVQLTDAPVIICEGDEYPASALDSRPKFHLLKPHIAIISGISWDHINVFPTWEQYLQQFARFIEVIEPHGSLIYNQDDATVSDLVRRSSRTDLQLIGYSLPKWTVEKGITFVYDDQHHAIPLRIFGEHNLLNLQAARQACALLGVSSTDFFRRLRVSRVPVVVSSSSLLIHRQPSIAILHMHLPRLKPQSRPSGNNFPNANL